MSQSLAEMKSESREVSPMKRFQALLVSQKDQIQNALPKHLTADRMTRLSLTAFTQNKALLECDAKSVIGSIITAAQLGLEIGVNGQGYLVPYKGRCQFIPGWKGLCDMVARAGRATVWTGAVFKGDEFEFSMGDRPSIVHRQGDNDDPNDITHVYAVGRVNGAEWPVIEVWRIARVWRHRDRYNKVGKAHYSYANPEMYARKIPLLQVLKYMPMSVSIQSAVQLSDAFDRGETSTIAGDYIVETSAPEERDAGQGREQEGGGDYDDRGSEAPAQRAQRQQAQESGTTDLD